MADIFELGFRIDTTPLNAAKTAAEGAAQSVSKLGDAEEKAARQARTLADAQRQASGAKGEAAANADRLANALGGLSGKISVSAQGLQQMAAVMGAGGAGGGGMAAGLGVASQALGRFAAALGPVGLAVGAAVIAITALGVAAKATLEPLAQASDRLELFKARLKNALEDAGLAETALADLTKMAAETGLGFQTTADAFLRFARANQTIGANNQQLLQFTETVQKLGAVSGASLGETQSAMMQLGQALSSGRLQGDELRSIGENAPAILKAIADGVGVSVGQIRAMGSAGELSTQKIFEALLKSTDKVRQEFSTLPDTVERQNQRLTDAWDRMLATMGERLKASDIYQFFQRQLLSAINAANEAMRSATPQEQTNERLRSVQSRIIGTGAEQVGTEGYRDRMAAIRGLAVVDDPKLTREARDAAEADITKYLSARVAFLRSVADGGGAGARDILRQLEEASTGVVQAMLAAEQRGRESAAVEARRSRVATIERGTAAGREYDDFQSRISKLNQARDAVTAAIAQARGSRTAGNTDERDQANASLPILERQLDAINREARRAQPALAKLRDEVKDAEEAARRAGGYGGGFQIMAEAIKAAQSAEAQGGSVGQFAREISKKRAEDLKEQADGLERQVTQQRALTAAQAQGHDAIQRITDAQEDANKQFEIVGNLSRTAYPELFAAMERVIGLQRQLRQESRATSEALANSISAATVSGLSNQTGAVSQGPGAVQRAAQEAEVQRIRLQQGEEAATRRQNELRAQNRLSDEQALEAARIAAGRASAVVGVSPRLRQMIETNQRADEAQRSASDPQKGQAIADQIRREGNAKMQDEMAQNLRNGEIELEQAQKRMQLVNMTTENMRVQEAVLRKETELRREGVEVESAYGQRLIAQTKEIELQTIAFEKQRAIVEGYFSIIDNAASGFKGVMISAFEESFRTGKFNAENFFNGLTGLIAKAGAEMMYEISIKPFVMAAANAAKMWASGLFSGGGGAGVTPQALGGAFTEGGVKAFAMGGIVGSPTLFTFANGGRLGMMGEAGPEAIMPLKRGPDGRLGVGGYGGGGGDVTVVVNDQRGKGEQVGVEQGTGPDGQRIISIMVRDEVKRAIRSGEMDRDMATNFGTTRPVQRR
jgi:tape measure domain-containing protein